MTAWQIMTGAPFPEGFDCSIKIEETELVSGANGKVREIIVRQSLEAFENLREAGEDFKKGDLVLNPGNVIGPEQILALEALGISKIPVFKKMVVAVISTGGELSENGAPLRDGQIPNSTSPFLKAALQQMGAEPVLFGVAGDDPKEYFSLLGKVLASQPDVIISTGAVSMGVHDYVSSVVRDRGGRVDFHGVLIRPGKPLLLAEFPNHGPIFFGLPGNPVATVVGLRFFVDPFLRARMGLAEEKPSWARVTETVRKPDGLKCFFKAQVHLGKGEPAVTILPGQPSFMVSPLLQSTAWGVLPEAGREIQKGEWVEVFPFYSSPYSWSQASVNLNPKSEKGCC
jgi:molybdopterin molybdotransferase